MTTDKVFWREKGSKQWREAFIVAGDSIMIKFGPWRGSDTGVWYDRNDVETKNR